MPAAFTIAPGTTGFATIDGTIREPSLLLRIHPKLPHPQDRRLTMLDWVKQLHGRWDPQERTWRLGGVGSFTPSQALAGAGIVLDWESRPGELQQVATIDELAVPIAKLHSNGRLIMVRHRLAGRDFTQGLLGGGAVWDNDRGMFWAYAGDVLDRDGNIRGGIQWPANAITRAFELRTVQNIDPAVAPLAKHLAHALNLDGIPAHDAAAFAPDGFPSMAPGRELLGYQEAGVLAVVAGRRGLFDEPGLGKTVQALMAARLLHSRRTLVVCPPLLNSNWAREVRLAGLPDPVVFRVGRKEPDLPEPGTVIIADSLLAARPETAGRISRWGADVMLVDEAHRMMTIGSDRSEAVLNVAASVRHAPIAITGTPMFASPAQLVPLLELTRTLSPVFGGRSVFLDDFCRQDRFGNWHAKQAALPRLKALLEHHVWVRRRKRDVLPQLPAKSRRELVVDVPLTEYRRTHKDVIAKIHAWVSWFVESTHGRMPDQNDIEQFAQTASFEIVSQLRRAAGLAKVTAAHDLIADHLNGTGFEDGSDGVRRWNRPLIIWTHHLDVAAALLEQVADAEAIIGSTTDRERDAIVERFQDGRVPVLVAAITKAGVGLTLTRSSDAIFVEVDWTPALVKQAEDRIHRIGQVNAPVYLTLIAHGTLDEPIQRVLGRKTKILEAGIGDTDDSVAVLGEDDAAGLMEIARFVIDDAVKTWRGPKKTKMQKAA